MRIVIVPWGDPSRWKLAEYCLDEPDGVRTCARGFSTLNLLFSSRSLLPDLVLLFALDTLAHSEGFSSYGELLSWAEGYVRRHLCVEDPSKVEVRILPGVMTRGTPSGLEFRAYPTDTRLLALYYTYTGILEAVAGSASEGGGLEVVLDTTHGINYFTMLVRESAYEAVAAAAMALGESVRVYVYNADPVAQSPRTLDRSPGNPCEPCGGDRPPAVSYNLLMREVVRPWDLVRYARYHSTYGKLMKDLRGCEPGKANLGEVIAFSKRVVSSLRVGALLELAEIVAGAPHMVDALSKTLGGVLKCWVSKARVSYYGDARRTEFTGLMEGFRLLIHAHSVASGVWRLLTSQPAADRPVRLKELRALRDALMAGSEVTATLVNCELGTIERMLELERGGRGVLPDAWTAYSEVLGRRLEVDQGVKEVDRQRLKRNFVAHVGLLGDLVELKRADGPEGLDVLLRVKPDRWPAVKEALDGVFSDLISMEQPHAGGPRAALARREDSRPTS